MGKTKRSGMSNVRATAPYRARRSKSNMDVDMEDLVEDARMNFPVPTTEEEFDKMEDNLYATISKNGDKPVTRGQILQRHKVEVKELRKKIKAMEDIKQRMGANTKAKKEKKKQIRGEIKKLEEDLKSRQQKELADFDESVKKPQLREVRLELQSINLNFGSLTLSGD